MLLKHVFSPILIFLIHKMGHMDLFPRLFEGQVMGQFEHFVNCKASDNYDFFSLNLSGDRIRQDVPPAQIFYNSVIIAIA